METATMHAETSLALELTPDETETLLKLYCANPVFRSAEREELVIEHNPFRRAVRPEDLEFLDYRDPLRQGNELELRALIAHRMLRNIYEAELLFLPPNNDPAVWQEYTQFYSARNVQLGERVRPALEEHVFSFLTANVQPVCDSAELADLIASAGPEAAAAEQKLLDAISATEHHTQSLNTYLLQLLAAYRNESIAITRSMAGEYDDQLQPLTHFLFERGDTQQAPAAMRSSLLKALARSCEFSDEPHSYWQFYLSSMLAVANYAYCMARQPRHFFRAIGARAYRELRFAGQRELHAEMFRNVYGSSVDTSYFDAATPSADAVIAHLITPLVERYGDRVAADIAQGFQENRRLHEIADEDFKLQIAFADKPEFYHAKGRRIYETIQERQIKVPLDTFVELSSETSTTHVHDDHRLLVIEEGEMQFWDAYGSNSIFKPGDITLVPKQRLHGSTVLSGQCTYHQPVISERLMSEFD